MCALTVTSQSSFVLAGFLGTWESMWPQAGGSYCIIAHLKLETRFIDIEKSISVVNQNLRIDLYRLDR